MSDWPKHYTLYLHSEKSSNLEDGRELGLVDEALDNFCYVGYEVGLDLEVNEDGKAYLVGINDEPVYDPDGGLLRIKV